MVIPHVVVPCSMHAFYKRHLMMNSHMSGYYAYLASSYESDINLENQIYNCEKEHTKSIPKLRSDALIVQF